MKVKKLFEVNILNIHNLHTSFTGSSYIRMFSYTLTCLVAIFPIHNQVLHCVTDQYLKWCASPSIIVLFCEVAPWPIKSRWQPCYLKWNQRNMKEGMKLKCHWSSVSADGTSNTRRLILCCKFTFISASLTELYFWFLICDSLLQLTFTSTFNVNLNYTRERPICLLSFSVSLLNTCHHEISLLHQNFQPFKKSVTVLSKENSCKKPLITRSKMNYHSMF